MLFLLFLLLLLLLLFLLLLSFSFHDAATSSSWKPENKTTKSRVPRNCHEQEPKDRACLSKTRRRARPGVQMLPQHPLAEASTWFKHYEEHLRRTPHSNGARAQQHVALSNIVGPLVLLSAWSAVRLLVHHILGLRHTSTVVGSSGEGHCDGQPLVYGP